VLVQVCASCLQTRTGFEETPIRPMIAVQVHLSEISLNVSVVEQALAAMLELLDVVKRPNEPSPPGSKNPRQPRKRNHESSVAR
jgi:hypothetical protein